MHWLGPRLLSLPIRVWCTQGDEMCKLGRRWSVEVANVEFESCLTDEIMETAWSHRKKYPDVGEHKGVESVSVAGPGR